ncbi:uncharacterized protein LOC144361674, partial [Saccoglossus kowalevskii]
LESRYHQRDSPQKDNDLSLQIESLGLSDSAYASALERGVLKSKGNISLTSKAFEDAGVTDPNVLDKSYWIKRVGELSIQLQQSSEYWSEKVRELSMQIELTQSIHGSP